MFDHAAVLKQPCRRGRPSRFSAELAAAICQRLADGQSLRAICRSEAMPHVATVLRWLPEHPEFRDQYAHARELQAECFVDQIVDIADAVAGEREAAIVNAARLAIDARKWAAAKLAPKRYGDKLGVENSGSVTVRIVTGLGDTND